MVVPATKRKTSLHGMVLQVGLAGKGDCLEVEMGSEEVVSFSPDSVHPEYTHGRETPANAEGCTERGLWTVFTTKCSGPSVSSR